MDGKDATNTNIPSSAETYDEAGVEQIYSGFFRFLFDISKSRKVRGRRVVSQSTRSGKGGDHPPSLHSFIIFVRLLNGSHNFTVVYASVWQPNNGL